MNIIKSNTYTSSLERINIDMFYQKSVIITGAVGMVGSCLVDALMQRNKNGSVFCNVFAVGRNVSSAQERFNAYCYYPGFTFIEQDISRPINNFPDHADYIIHAASNADPVSFSKRPVDVLLSNIIGTENLLNYGISHGMSRFLFVSSGEMYGQPDEQMNDFVENYCGPIDHSDFRSCYPTGKRAAEVLCQSYLHQYNADIVITRPCHLFGPTMTRKDSRAVTEFLWSAVDRRDITLKSAGLVERSHCYILDAASAMLTVLASGECGEAYNIADPEYQMTIRDFAMKASSAGGCKVVFEHPNDIEFKGYSKIKRSVLDATKLLQLGWIPRCSSGSAIEDTISILREIQ